MVNFRHTLETQQCKVFASKKHKAFYIDTSRPMLIFGIIAQLLALLELFKNRDFVLMGKGVQEVALCKRWPELLVVPPVLSQIYIYQLVRESSLKSH